MLILLLLLNRKCFTGCPGFSATCVTYLLKIIFTRKVLFILTVITYFNAGEYSTLFGGVTVALIIVGYSRSRPSTGYLKFLTYVAYLMLTLSVVLSYLIFYDIKSNGNILWEILYLCCASILECLHFYFLFFFFK